MDAYLPKSGSNLAACVRMTFIFTCECKVSEIVQSNTRIIGCYEYLE